jgi:16S rRNA processing protein RimM
VSFEEMADRTAAEALRGTEVFVDADQARALDADEYWDHDLVGCTVVTTDGKELGDVVDVLHGANDVLVVREGDREHLLPLIRDVVRSVEPRERITVQLLPGLLD